VGGGVFGGVCLGGFACGKRGILTGAPRGSAPAFVTEKKKNAHACIKAEVLFLLKRIRVHGIASRRKKSSEKRPGSERALCSMPN